MTQKGVFLSLTSASSAPSVSWLPRGEQLSSAITFVLVTCSLLGPVSTPKEEVDLGPMAKGRSCLVEGSCACQCGWSPRGHTAFQTESAGCLQPRPAA